MGKASKGDDEEDPIKQPLLLVPIMAGKEVRHDARHIVTIAGHIKSTMVEVTKEQATAQLWRLAYARESAREDLAKSNYVDVAMRIFVNGTPEELHSAAGLLTAMCKDPENSNIDTLLKNSIESKIGATMKRVFAPTWSHARSKVTMAALLDAMSTHPTHVIKLHHLVPSILLLLECTEPSWANIVAARQSCVCALFRILTALSNPDLDVKYPGLVDGVMTTLLTPATFKILSRNLKRGPDLLTTKAAGCMRLLAAHKRFKLDLVDTNTIQMCLNRLLLSDPEKQAFLSGMLWEVSSDDKAKLIIGDADGCSIMCRAVQAALNGAGGKKGKKKSSKKGLGNLPPHVDAIVCNCTGVIYHLSFFDAYKLQLRDSGAAELLLLASTSKNLQVYENCTGALWNIGLEPSSLPVLSELKAPAYLAEPVPRSWMASDNAPTDLPVGPSLNPVEAPPPFEPEWDRALHLIDEGQVLANRR